MAAMRMPALMLYDPRLFAASVLIAIALSVGALWLLLASQRFMKSGRLWLQVLAATVMGLSITAMHYTAMMATHFFEGQGTVAFSPSTLDLQHLNSFVSGSILLLLGLALVAKQVSKRMDRHIAAAERSDALLGAVLRYLPSPAFVMDPDGKLLTSNAAFDAEAGEADIGKGLNAADRAALANGAAIEREERGAADRRVYLSTKFPVRDGEGRIIAFAGVSLDITQRKRAEEALRRREQQLAAAQRIAHIGHWSIELSADGASFECSEEIYRIYGLARDGPMSFEIIVGAIHDEDRPWANRNRDRAIVERRGYDFAFRIHRPDGEIRHVEGRTVPVLADDGEVTGYVGVTQDVTERERGKRRSA
jgi:PAS domain S-box-containing protein